MKRKLSLLAGIVSMALVLILMGCDTGTSGGGGEGQSLIELKSVGSGARVYVLDISSSTNKSVRNMQAGNEYELKIIKPSVSGSNIVYNEQINRGIVQSISGRSLMLKPNSGSAFTITLDAQDNMIELENMSNDEDGPLFPVGEDTINLDGIWIYNAWNQTDISTMIVNGNAFTSTTVGNYKDKNGQHHTDKDYFQMSTVTIVGNSYTITNVVEWIWEEKKWEPGGAEYQNQTGTFVISNNGNTVTHTVTSGAHSGESQVLNRYGT